MSSWIVLSRLLDDFEIVGKARIDAGESHKTRDIKVARALVWRRNVKDHALPAELLKAQEAAKDGGYSVFVYPSTERDPLNRAKRDLLKQEDLGPSVGFLYMGAGKPLARQ